jgi:hypothetical protein
MRSCSASGTYTRLIAEHTWPLFWNAPQNSFSTTVSTSTSSSTMAGSFPPSSRVVRLRSGAAAAATFLPVATEPVKLILRGTGCDVIDAPSGSLPLITLSTPGGRTSRRTSPTFRVARGVKGEGLSTMVFPASRAGAIFHEASTSGKFHGVMPATTPSGRWTTSTKAASSSWMTWRGISSSA